MTTNQPDDVITKADVTKHDTDYVRSLEERVTVLQGQLDAWTERFARDTQALQDRIGELTDLLSLTQRESANSLIAYAKLRQEHTRLKYTLSRVQPTAHPQQALHHDELGPILKDDLDADALRDGRLERSQESRQRILAKHPDSGEAGIEFGPDECRRPNCPTKGPHRHLVHSPGIQASTNNAMHPLDDPLSQASLRIKATIEDPDSDAFPTKANPRHVKEPTAFQDFVSSLPDETLDHSKPPMTDNGWHPAGMAASYRGEPMDVNNIVGGPNEPALATERHEFAEQAVANVLNQAFDANKEFDLPAGDENFSLPAGTSDETLNSPDKGTEQR